MAHVVIRVGRNLIESVITRRSKALREWSAIQALAEHAG